MKAFEADDLPRETGSSSLKIILQLPLRKASRKVAHFPAKTNVPDEEKTKDAVKNRKSSLSTNFRLILAVPW